MVVVKTIFCLTYRGSSGRVPPLICGDRHHPPPLPPVSPMTELFRRGPPELGGTRFSLFVVAFVIVIVVAAVAVVLYVQLRARTLSSAEKTKYEQPQCNSGAKHSTTAPAGDEADIAEDT